MDKSLSTARLVLLNKTHPDTPKPNDTTSFNYNNQFDFFT